MLATSGSGLANGGPAQDRHAAGQFVANVARLHPQQGRLEGISAFFCFGPGSAKRVGHHATELTFESICPAVTAPSETPMTERLLCVDDDEDACEMLAASLRQLGYQTESTT